MSKNQTKIEKFDRQTAAVVRPAAEKPARQRVQRVETDPEIIELNRQLAEMQARQKLLRLKRREIKAQKRANGMARNAARLADVVGWIIATDANLELARAAFLNVGVALDPIDDSTYREKFNAARADALTKLELRRAEMKAKRAAKSDKK